MVGGVLSPFPNQVFIVMQTHKLMSLKIQVFNSPMASISVENPATLASVQQQASPAGLSITASFLVSNEASFSRRSVVEKTLKEALKRVVLDIFSRRWILGSLESIQRPRLHRFVHVDWQNMEPTGDAYNIPVLVSLPHEAFSLSSEGIREFHKTFIPCSGILETNSPTEWSNLLLGHEESIRKRQEVSDTTGSRSIPGRKGLWVDIKRDRNDHYVMDTGMLWRIRTRNSDISWSNLLGNEKSSSLQLCPVTESTSLQVLPNIFVPVQDNCDTSDWEVSRDVHHQCIKVAKRDLVKRPSKEEHNFFSIQSYIQRTQGPGYAGRIETVVSNHHPFCDVTITVLQVIPPVLKPKWSTFGEKNGASRPRRHWEDDGTLVLTLNTTLRAQSDFQYGFEYDPVFLSIETFPADPNRGFEIPPVRVMMEPLCNDTDLPRKFSLFSESLLFLSPLPDASMPFNVLSLSCTLLAFLVGSLLNLLVRRASERLKYKLYPELRPKSKFQKIKDRVKRKVKNMRDKVFPPKNRPGKAGKEKEE
jgi:phosphatidylinositol glycan class T